MKKYDVVHAEKYTSGGEEKTRWIKCGAVLSTKSGGFALKLDVVPINGNGWFSLFEPNDDKPKETKRARTQAQSEPDPDDDIPF